MAYISDSHKYNFQPSSIRILAVVRPSWVTTLRGLSGGKPKRSIKFESGRYKVAISWKNDWSVLPDNYETAVRRRTEKRVLKDLEESLRKEDLKNREKAH